MNVNIPIDFFRFDGSRAFSSQDFPTKIEAFYDGKKEYKKLLEEFQEEIDDLQNMMYAHDKYAMLLIFQAMDAAGKDGTIRHVMSGINPHGVVVSSFKKPSSEELDHDYLWRTQKQLPQRGRIGIFNRSYYEEVLVVKVHPGILTGGQKIPSEHLEDVDKVFEDRYHDIKNMEGFLHRNGTQIVKFYLHLSKAEQKERFMDRLNTPAKNWKFSEHDVKERGYWDKYMLAYEDVINKTATPDSPWYAIPADDKKNMRLIVSAIILHHMQGLDMKYPEVDEARKAEFQTYRDMLDNE
ncbi:MAG: polyphosphate kinase 2 family protein [Bacteroidota bacterium]